MNPQIDAVAQAICAVQNDHPTYWQYAGTKLRDRYRLMAQAAIDALQLSEERIQTRHAAAWDMGNDEFQSRLVSPWVSV